MKINILREFWNFEVNESSTASGGGANLKNSCYAIRKTITRCVNKK